MRHVLKTVNSPCRVMVQLCVPGIEEKSWVGPRWGVKGGGPEWGRAGGVL